jgi:hypothetical protein
VTRVVFSKTVQIARGGGPIPEGDLLLLAVAFAVVSAVVVAFTVVCLLFAVILTLSEVEWGRIPTHSTHPYRSNLSTQTLQPLPLFPSQKIVIPTGAARVTSHE